MELFPTAMSPWVDQTAGCCIVAGSLLRFKHHTETATNEGKDDLFVWAWIPPRFSI